MCVKPGIFRKAGLFPKIPGFFLTIKLEQFANPVLLLNKAPILLLKLLTRAKSRLWMIFNFGYYKLCLCFLLL
jgi:hypothetical protein